MKLTNIPKPFKSVCLLFIGLLISTFGITTLHKDKTSAANTTFNISAGPDAVASGDGCRLSEAIANINASTQTHSDCPAGVSVSGDINVISLPADTVTISTDLATITKPTSITGQGKKLSIVDAGATDSTIFNIVLDSSVSNPNLEYKDFTLKNVGYSSYDEKCLWVMIDAPGSISVEGVDAIDCATYSFYLGSPNKHDNIAISVLGSSASRTFYNERAFLGFLFERASDVTVKDSTANSNFAGMVSRFSEGITHNFSMSNTTLVNNVGGLQVGPTEDGAPAEDSYTSNVSLTNNTIYSSYNRSPEDNFDEGGMGIQFRGIYDGGAVPTTNVFIKNNIFASNGKVIGSSVPSKNCFKMWELDLTITSLGNNLSDDGCLSSFTSSDILSDNIDSTISALADNGGAVKTLALLPGSPAIDTAATVDTITTDARGFARPFGVAYDIGAFEYGSGPVDPPPPPKPPKTGRLAAASLITVSILAIVLLIAKGFKGRLHRSRGL